MYTTAVGVDPDDSNIIYTSSHVNHALQRVDVSDGTLLGNDKCWKWYAKWSKNTGDAGSLGADDVEF